MWKSNCVKTRITGEDVDLSHENPTTPRVTHCEGSHLSTNTSTSTEVKNGKNEVYSDASRQSLLTFDPLWCDLACEDETLRTVVSV